eukprot:g24503.t1
MDTGHRLQLEGLDLKISSQSLQDARPIRACLSDPSASGLLLIPACLWGDCAMASDSRSSTSNQAYGSFWKAVPLEPKVLAVPVAERAHQEAAARHELLLQRLRAQNLRERPVEGDGNCQFRALSDQLYGSQEQRGEVQT